MNNRTILAGTLGVAVLLSAQITFGAGFGIYEGSARGNALGTEVTANPGSPSVIYNNPAAMTDLRGTQVEAGVTLINPSATVVGETPAGTVQAKAKDNWWTPPHANVTHRVNSRVWAGMGIFSRYGLGVEYDDNWFGRYNVQKATIQSLEINPSLAFKVLDNLSLAAGLRAQWFDFELKRAVTTDPLNASPLTDLQLKMCGDSWGIGYNLSAYFKPTEWLSVGLAYESEIEQEIDGTYTLTGGQQDFSGDGSGEITTPSLIRLGVSAKATDKLTLNAGLVYTMWSSYEELAIEFDPALLGSVSESVTEKNWKDVFRYQLGAEYALNQTWSLLAGYVYDRTPDPDANVDYLVPANHRHLFSIGAGYKKNNFFCDFGYTYLLIEDRDVEGRAADGVFSGQFKDGDAHMLAVSVGYKI